MSEPELRRFSPWRQSATPYALPLRRQRRRWHLLSGLRWWRIITLATCVLCQACTPLSSQRPAPPDNPVPAQRFLFRDGGSALFYTVDKSLSLSPELPASTIVFFISGSDCASMQYFLPQYFRGLEGESGPIRILVLQKRFIDAQTWGRDTGCSRDFIKADHFSQWLADQTEFITAQLAGVPLQDRPQRIVIAGVSEGGEVVPALARTIPGVTHAVVIGNGGMHPLDAYRLLLAKHPGSKATRARAALRSLAQHPADPDAGIEALGGRSWRYWSELAALHHTDNLLALSMPLHVAVGGADTAVPVASARYLQQQFDLHHKSNLRLKIYPGADHGLKTNSHINLGDFWFQFDVDMRK